MATAVAITPGAVTITPVAGGIVLVSVIGDAHIITAPPVAAVGSAVVGTSIVG